MSKHLNMKIRVSVLNNVKATCKVENIPIGKFIGDAIFYFKDEILLRLTVVDIWAISKGLDNKFESLEDEVEYQARISKMAWDIFNADKIFKKRFLINIICAVYIAHLTKKSNDISKFVDSVMYINAIQRGEVMDIKKSYGVI